MTAEALIQAPLFSKPPAVYMPRTTDSTFVDNMKLPVHRWFRYSAGFSAQWVESVIADAQSRGSVSVFDPFAGSGTTLIASESSHVDSIGIEAHPFVARIAKAKLHYGSDPDAFLKFARFTKEMARELDGTPETYPSLIRRCYEDDVLSVLDSLRRAWVELADDTPESELVWLALAAILRPVSHVGTAPWQYVLPGKAKRNPRDPIAAYDAMIQTMRADMRAVSGQQTRKAELISGDARTCEGTPTNYANLIVSSPPYPNNYDYADATRLEMSFFGEVSGWGDLQDAVRKYLVRSCSQHMSERSVQLADLLSSPELNPIHDDITQVCRELSVVRQEHGGHKAYHLMVAAYFIDLAQTWSALRRVSQESATVCFVVGDSAPYGVYVPVIDWLGALALDAGFSSFAFEKTRDRNVKWKNRKHQVPLCEGRLWVRG